MSKIAVIYWSGTGNTEMLANALAGGAEKAGASVDTLEVDAADAAKLGEYDGIMFGCPAMGDEVLEESTFEPFFAEAEKNLRGVPVVLFGSYGWGGGAWMEAWASRTKDAGAKLFNDGIAVENAPDDEKIAECGAIGENFAKSLA